MRWDTEFGLDGGDDDRLATAFFQRIDGWVDAVDHAHEVDFHQLPEQFGVLYLVKVGPHALAGVGNELVERAEFLDGCLDEFFRILRRGDIAGEHQQIIAQFVGQFAQLGFVAGHEREACAALDGLLSQLKAESTGRPGDGNSLAGEAHECD